MDLLLLSNSTNYASTMFAHAAAAFNEVAAGEKVTFVPFALADWDDYADRVTAALGSLDIDVMSAHRSATPGRAILDAGVVMMGGGNTFRLLDSLYRLGVIEGLSQNVRDGSTRYMGASAGTNVACPTLRTTNDMPICQPPSFTALGLIPFQINLHYVDADPASTFMGESRDERIEEFLEENDCPVLAMYEGSWLRVSGEAASVTGPARLFQRAGREAFQDGVDVSQLLHLTPRFDDGRRPVRGDEPTSSPTAPAVGRGIDPNRGSLKVHTKLGGDLSAIRPCRPTTVTPPLSSTSRSIVHDPSLRCRACRRRRPVAPIGRPPSSTAKPTSARSTARPPTDWSATPSATTS